ncbi:MAG: hypothetical protein LC793_05100, partial [Thermomicrobia bacterium]|nr:hypothetical protein [Thermomicrobia bacterium]
MSQNTARLIVEALSSVALAVIPIVGAYLVAYLKKHLTQSQLATAITVAHVVVQATEQVNTATGATGSQKYATA